METQIKNSPAFSQVIRERHSVRKYDSSRKLSGEEINDLLNDAILAPSSSNLQPWRFIVITDQALKEQLLPIANNQPQVVTSSAVIAVLGDLEAYRNVETIWDSAVEEGHATPDVRNMMVEKIRSFYPVISREKQKEIALVDGGLVSMQLMLAAKAKGYDTVAMGGYDADQFREMFQIPERYATVMLIAVGYADVTARSTVRLPLADVAFYNGFQP